MRSGSGKEGSAILSPPTSPVLPKMPSQRAIIRLETDVGPQIDECWSVHPGWMTMAFRGDTGFWPLFRVGNIFLLWRIVCERLYGEPLLGTRPGVKFEYLPVEEAPTYKRLYDSWYFGYFLSARATQERQMFCHLFGHTGSDGVWRFSNGMQQLIEVVRNTMWITGNMNRVHALYNQLGFCRTRKDVKWVPTHPDPIYDSDCLWQDLRPRPEIPQGATVCLRDIERTLGRAPRWRTVDPVPSIRTNMCRPGKKRAYAQGKLSNEAAAFVSLPTMAEQEGPERVSVNPVNKPAM
jgi:hypothetical protein